MVVNFDVQQAAAYLKISVRGVHRHASNDSSFPPRLKRGRATMFSKAALDKWLESQRSA
ncbi:helix-turn-helix domain-containing protein [Chitinibacter bivalviorum]|uniref:Helix-turn-helix domain-containing protein n=1 Tax=Chitinibacter bivalviorum TaxID=2739434 RepID=A0A7H9BGA5_9NEIS|nr:helix-turn-helix domain-containing protein [Chitinibacter bivalviorum]